MQGEKETKLCNKNFAQPQKSIIHAEFSYHFTQIVTGIKSKHISLCMTKYQCMRLCGNLTDDWSLRLEIGLGSFVAHCLQSKLQNSRWWLRPSYGLKAWSMASWFWCYKHKTKFLETTTTAIWRISAGLNIHFFSWNCGGKDNLKVQSYSDQGNWYGLKFEIILNE